MTSFGYFLSSEEQSARSLVDNAVRAEQAGIDLLWLSDHYHPWTDAQGESTFVWSILGAIAARTERLRVTTAVTCPIMRIHPAIIAQAVATTQILFDGRFRFGIGSGEALNEHVLGDAWPGAEVRQDMLEEAVDVMRQLWTGDLVRHSGTHYTVDTARLYSLPEHDIEVLISAFGPKATKLAASIGDGFMTVQPEGVSDFREAGGTGTTQGGLKVCWNADEAEARKLVHQLWPNEALEGEVLQLLTSPKHFTQLTDALVDEDRAASSVGAVGNRVEDFVAAVKPYVDEGFDEVYVSQIGPDQEGFLRFWQNELAPALAEL